MDQKWFKYSYVCPDCDSLLEYTIKSGTIPANVNMHEYRCICKTLMTIISVRDASIGENV